ncbi:hypothetical protein [Leucobacter sp. G161]|uniref:hypothetical protein n=1 Tax=Leucobacter sp. G161 TaxID=663704 RepID=UPI000B1066B4|nr:hypothetical protein [Leucobacter sp. G161]
MQAPAETFALLLECKAKHDEDKLLELMLREARDEEAVVLEFVVTRAAHLLGVDLG